jgi:hypothetical protein
MRIGKKLLALGIVAVFINSCKTEPEPEQKYDIGMYVVTFADAIKIEAQAKGRFGSNDPTEYGINEMEKWIVQNTSGQYIRIAVDSTKEEITKIILGSTSYSRDNITTIFEKVDSIGKYYAVAVTYSGDYWIVVIDKI